MHKNFTNMKTIKRFFVCLFTTACMLSFTNCQSVVTALNDQQTQQMIGAIITNLVGQRGSNYTYNGKGTKQELALKENGKPFEDYIEASKTQDYTGTYSVTINNTNANLVLPNMVVGNGTISGMRIYNLMLETVSGGTKLSISDNSTIDGTFTINGVDIKPTNLYIDAVITNQQFKINLMSIYYGENGEHVANLTFDGAVAQK